MTLVTHPLRNIAVMMMDIERGRKRTKRTSKGAKKVPRRTTGNRRAVIPGLLKQTGNEKKVLYTGTNTPGSGVLLFNSTGTILGLNFIQVGSSMFNRIGRRIEMLSVRFTGHIECIAGLTRSVLPDYARLVIVYDRQTNGAYPTISDMFQDTDQAGVNTTLAQSGINMDNRERFVVIMDYRIYLPQATVTAGVVSAAFPVDTMAYKPLVDEYRRLGKLTTHYKADSNPAVIGDISTGGLFVVAFADQTAATSAFSMNEWNVRLKYIDV